MQIAIVILIVLWAAGYATMWLYDAFRDGGDPCKGCELKKNCKKFCQSK